MALCVKVVETSYKVIKVDKLVKEAFFRYVKCYNILEDGTKL
jgi:hypothetical protein